jgi:hypothetical protein
MNKEDELHAVTDMDNNEGLIKLVPMALSRWCGNKVRAVVMKEWEVLWFLLIKEEPTDGRHYQVRELSHYCRQGISHEEGMCICLTSAFPSLGLSLTSLI